MGTSAWICQPQESGNLHSSLGPVPKSCINSAHFYTWLQQDTVIKCTRSWEKAKSGPWWRMCFGGSAVNQSVSIPGSPLLLLGGPCALAKCLWLRDMGWCWSKGYSPIPGRLQFSHGVKASAKGFYHHRGHQVPFPPSIYFPWSPVPFCTMPPPIPTALWLV